MSRPIEVISRDLENARDRVRELSIEYTEAITGKSHSVCLSKEATDETILLAIRIGNGKPINPHESSTVKRLPYGSVCKSITSMQRDGRIIRVGYGVYILGGNDVTA